MKKNLIVVLLFLVLFALNAEVHGVLPSGAPSMTFEGGGIDYFVMFNSLLDDTVTLYGEAAENSQGDICLNKSSFTLTNKHIPSDAVVEHAYLVWMGAVAPDKLDEPTDNEVTLFFYNENPEYPLTDETTVKAGDIGEKLSSSPSFEFEGIRFENEVEVGCSETSDGSTVKADLGYFTYRVDVTEFMQRIQKAGVVVDGEGDALYGKYTVSDLDCTDHDNYRCRTTMVSAWALILIYRSNKVHSKMIYFYNGLSYVQGEISEVDVSGFDLPFNPIVRQTLMVAEGDPALEVNPALPKEGILLTGEGATTSYHLYNKCNPKNGLDYEIYNSNSSIINWDPDAVEEDLIFCVSGGEGEQKYGIDVDTFLLDTKNDEHLQEHLARGNTTMTVTLSVNQDAVISNFLILSVDISAAQWDVPPEAKNLPFPEDREKTWCACPLSNGSKREHFCYDERPFYYLIKVENWGTNVAKDVTVSDELVDMEYLPGTAEIATQYSESKGYYIDWKSIPDRDGTTPNEKFPLGGEGYAVAGEMTPCDVGSWTCEDSRLIRFLVKPKRGLPMMAVLKNVAVISDASNSKYSTNNDWAIPISGQTCVDISTCSQPTKKDCGGVIKVCQEDADCESGEKCDVAAGECMPKDEDDGEDVMPDVDDEPKETDDISTDDRDVLTTKNSSCSATIIELF